MAQIIIYQNPEASNVVLCFPSGELPIEEVLVKDCPPGAMIVDDSILPIGADAKFFDAWVLNKDNSISVDINKAKEIKLDEYNSYALIKANMRNLNNLAGIANELSDEEWLAKLSADRQLINSSTTTDQLISIENPK